MISPDPAMSDALYEKCLDFATNPDTKLTHDEIMVQYWDEVSESVLALSDKYNLPPLVVIDEFCVDSDWPTDPMGMEVTQ